MTDLMQRIADLLAADPICGGRVTADTVEDIAGLLARQADEGTIRTVERERCARAAELFAIEAESTLAMTSEGSIPQAAVRGNVAAGWGIAVLIRALPPIPEIPVVQGHLS